MTAGNSLSKKQVVISMIGIMLALFLSSMEQTIVGTAMPQIITSLGGFEHYTWVTTAYLMASTSAMIISGRLSDIYGRRLFLIIGSTIFVIGSFTCGHADSMGFLIFSRAMQGIGGGMLMGMAFTTVADLFPPQKRGRFMGFLSAMFGLSAIFGPTLGGWITDNFDWSWVFYINVPLGLVVVAIMLFAFPSLKPARKSKPDILGLALLASFIVCFVLGLTWGGSQYAWNSPQIIGLLSASALILAIFIWLQSRIKDPTMHLSMFKSRVFTPAAIATFIQGIGMFSAIIFVPLYFQGVFGSTATTSGNFLTPMMLANVCTSAFIGILLSRLPFFRAIGTAGILFLLIGLLLLSSMSPATPYGLAVLYIVVTGIGIGSMMPIFSLSMQNAVPHRMVGMATSTNGFMRTMGGAVGLAIGGSALSTNLAPNIFKAVPDYIVNALPPGFIDKIAQNPQALFSQTMQEQILQVFTMFGENQDAYFELFISGIRQGLSQTINTIFIIAALVFLVALVATFFLDDKSLRKAFKKHPETTPAEPIVFEEYD